MNLICRHWHIITALATVIALASAVPAHAQSLGMIPGADFGTFSVGAGFFNAPDAESDESGLYGLVRLEISTFAVEIDYTLDGSNSLLGAIDYLYYIPTAEMITQTTVAVGAGYTFVQNDGAFTGSNGGFNVLGQVRVADTITAQVRYDLLNGESDLLTFGLSYAFY